MVDNEWMCRYKQEITINQFMGGGAGVERNESSAVDNPQRRQRDNQETGMRCDENRPDETIIINCDSNRKTNEDK